MPTTRTRTELLDDFRAAWLGGMAPLSDTYLALCAPAERDALETEICDWLINEAPTVIAHPQRAAELLDNPAVRALLAIELNRDEYA